MIEEYDNEARQLEVQAHLDNLNLQSLMKEHAITDERVALRKLCALIDRLIPQAHPTFRNDTYRLLILSLAVAIFNWASAPRSQLLPQN